MSYYLEILSETSYQKFLNQLNNNLSYEEIEEFFDDAVIYDTSFSYFSGADRLLDVLEKFLSKVGLLNHNLKALTHQFKHEMLTCNVTTIEKLMALQLKHETLTRGMTIIEKTMSLQQLWESNSPFWTEKLNGRAVINVLRAFSLSEQTQEQFDFESVYDKVTNSLTGRLTNARPYLNI